MNNNGIKIFVFAALLISGFSVICTAAPSLSNAVGGNWQFYRDITITEKSGSVLTDYQILLQLSGSYLPVTRSDGADIRFTDSNDKELPYWIEDYTGGSARIWVKVPNIPANGQAKIKMYYGNPGAGAVSNGDNTFDFFDDASGTFKNKWIDIDGNGSYSIIGGKQAISLNSATTNIRTLNYQMSGPIAIDAALYATEVITAIQYYQDSNPSTNERYQARIDVREGGYEYILKDGPFIGSFQDIFSSANTWISTRLTVDKNGNHQWYIGGRLAAYATDTSYSNGYLVLNHHDTGSGAVANLRVRKYAFPEPMFALGAEQPVLTPPTTGNISVSSSLSGTEVLVDGASKGAAPVTVPNVSSGSHAVKCKLPGYADYDTTATVTAGATTSVTCSMPQSNGNISITSSPSGAEVLVDGASKGTAPVTVPNISPGSHAVKCKLSGYSNDDTSATVTAGATTLVSCSLVQAGELSVKLTSEPASIQPGQISTIKISVTKDDTPISGVKIMLSAIPSVKFSPSSGTTTNGEFISTFTSSTEGEIKVSALAKREGSTDGKGEAVVQVGKINLTPTTTTGKQATITGKVIDAGTDDPVQDVIITVDGKSAVTGSNGEYELSVDVGKHNLSASKSGYGTMARSIIVPEVGTVFDISLKSVSGDTPWFWIVIILTLAVVAAGIIYFFNRKKKLKEKKQMEEKVKKEKEAKEEKEKRDKETKEKEEREKREKEKREKEAKKKICMHCSASVPLDAEFCPKCGKKQEEKKRFCMNCGSSMPPAPDLCPNCNKMPPSDVDTKTCNNCGEVIPAVAKFCGACGARQPE